MMAMRDEGYKSPTTGAGRIGCAVASIFGIVVGMPFLFIVTYTSGGCEGAPQPCDSDDTWLWVGLVLVAAACTGIGLLTRNAIIHRQRR
jgi:hypothetical protein